MFRPEPPDKTVFKKGLYLDGVEIHKKIIREKRGDGNKLSTHPGDSELEIKPSSLPKTNKHLPELLHCPNA
jgi:hypothetical protein